MLADTSETFAADDDVPPTTEAFKASTVVPILRRQRLDLLLDVWFLEAYLYQPQGPLQGSL